MAATLTITLRDVALHDAGHYFLTVQYLTPDGDEKKVRTEVSAKTNKPEFKNRSFSLPVRATDGVLDDAELQFGAFLVVRSEGAPGDGEQRATAKGTAKLAGLCGKRLADLAPALAAGSVAEPVVLTHPDGATIGSLIAEMHVTLSPGAAPLRASAEQLNGSSYEVVVRNAINLAGVTGGGAFGRATSAGGGGGGGGLIVSIAAVHRGVTSAELARTRPALETAPSGGLVGWNETLVVRPAAPFVDETDGLVVTLFTAGGGAGGGGDGNASIALARAHVPLAALRDESARELRVELAEAAGAALLIGFRKLPPAAPAAARLELELRQLRAQATGLLLPPAGAVTVALRFRELSAYSPGSLPWRHAYVPPAPGASDALRRIVAEPPALADARAVTWPCDGGAWPHAHSWTLDVDADAPAAGSGIVVEFYVPEWLPADGGAPGGDAVEWRLWAHATLPTPAAVQAAAADAGRAGGGAPVDVPFEAPLILNRDAALVPGASPPPILAGSIRWLPAAHAVPRAPAASARSPAGTEPGANAVCDLPPAISLVPAHEAARSAAALASAPHAQLLVELEQKQALINRLLREVDARTAALSRCGHELVTLRDKHSALEAEHARARRDLADKARSVDRLALDAGQAEHLDPVELARRHRMLGGAYRAEKARSDDLSAQLATLSQRVGSARRLENAYVALQDAHRAQGAELQRAQVEAGSLLKYKQAVKAQEKLIAKLEALVKPALRDQRAAKEASADAGAMRARLALLEAMHAEAAGIGTEEHVKLVMRAEQAERRATATEAEMADAARSYAREIAGLKVRLAEKEAELLGGFGAPHNAGNWHGSAPAAGGKDGHANGGVKQLGGSLGPGAHLGSAADLAAEWRPSGENGGVRDFGSRPAPIGVRTPPGGGILRRNSGARLESLVPRTPPPPSHAGAGAQPGIGDGGALSFGSSAGGGEPLAPVGGGFTPPSGEYY
ncbi:hypothetical protein KFE25_004341 [Diacronema lutheri]|uniref:Uncharacterized protein n=1 Tax=Diacronema lutheri TaxID=2081491 RepID=A0A8J5X3I1_DIALT|nr:hypothetical protein KFE25_004341 [Diacronema lutheri]